MPELLPSPFLATSAEVLDVDDLRCPICFAIMLAPRVLPGCGGQRSHSFCAPCITFWLRLQRDSGLPPTCPIDRRVIGKDEVVTRDPAIEAAIARLLVRCPNHRLGCSARFELGEGSAHLDVCAFRTVQCPLCAKPQSAEKLARHVERCFKPCGKCGVNVPRADSLLHDMGLCLAKEHMPWWPASQANAFTIWRDATKSQLRWLLDGAAPVADWRRANAQLIALLETHALPHVVASRDEDGCDVGADQASVGGADEEPCSEEEDAEASTGASAAAAVRPPLPTWKDALALLERSAPLCLELAELCRTHNWRAPWLALCMRAATLDPASVEAKLRYGDALLANAKASEACEAFVSALEIDSELLLAVSPSGRVNHPRPFLCPFASISPPKTHSPSSSNSSISPESSPSCQSPARRVPSLRERYSA